jgi:hypothetical protein
MSTPAKEALSEPSKQVRLILDGMTLHTAAFWRGYATVKHPRQNARSTSCRRQEYMHEQGFPRQSAKHGRRPNVARSRKTMLAKIEHCLQMQIVRGIMPRKCASICLKLNALNG